MDGDDIAMLRVLISYIVWAGSFLVRLIIAPLFRLLVVLYTHLIKLYFIRPLVFLAPKK